MAKVLVITKADKTRNIAPLVNKAALTAYNNKLAPENKMKIEEMEEEEAEKLAYIDESHITAGEALEKTAELTTQLSEKDQRIAELEALLKEKETVPEETGKKPKK